MKIEEFGYGNGYYIYYVNNQGKLASREYHENMSEIISIESMIDDTESDLNELKKQEEDLLFKLHGYERKIDNLPKLNAQRDFFGIMYFLGIPCSSACIFFSLLIDYIMPAFFLTGLFSIVSVALGIITIRIIPNKESLLKKIEEIGKKLNGKNVQISFLEKTLTKLYDKWTELMNQNEPNFDANEEAMKENPPIVSVDYREQLEQQRAYLELMNKFGCNEDKWIEAFDDCRLFESLSQDCDTEDEIVKAWDYVLENQGLIRERVIKRNNERKK